MTDTGGPDIVLSTAEGVVAVLGSCVTILHRQAATGSFVSGMGLGYAKAAAHGESIAIISVIQPEASLLPPGDVRAGIGGIMHRFDKRIAAAALVYEAEGFTATVVRSVATSLALAHRITHPLRVFADVAAACVWVAETSALATPEDWCRYVAELRATPIKSGPSSRPTVTTPR